MKAFVLLFSAFLFQAGMIHAAQPPQTGEVVPHRGHRVIFEMTSPSPSVWNGVLNNIENLRKALGDDTEVEVVAHGNGLAFLRATNVAQEERMKQLAGSGVIFAACRNTMKRQNVSADQLLPFAVTVDSGVAEIVRRQEEGWSYVRTGE